MIETTKANAWQEVASPFCGIGCDDLTIKVDGNHVVILENGDAVTRLGFETALSDITPRIRGEEVSLQQAVAHVVELLKHSKQPVISGLATDVNGVRAAIALADKTRATIDHMASKDLFKNILVLQDTGWMTTTFTEVRNRVDLLLIVGGDIELEFPRFFERMVWNKESLFDQDIASRRIVYLGKQPLGKAATSPEGKQPQIIACDDKDLPQVLSVLRALINGRHIATQHVGGIAIKTLVDLADRLKHARYSVVTWSAAMVTLDHAELSIQTLCEMVKDLNLSSRCNGLPLAGKEGDITATQVVSWQSGYPMRVNFSQGFPSYDPYLFDTRRMLQQDEVDCLVWVSSFNINKTPPKSNATTIVLGRSGMVFEREPEVYIPVGTPGIDHEGRAFRSDGVVSMPLRKLRDSGLPSAFEVLSAIEQAF